MWQAAASIIGSIVGVALSVGLLLSPRLIPGGYGYGIGNSWTATQVVLLVAAGLVTLSATLWLSAKLIKDAQSWKETRVIIGTVLVALVANVLFSVLVDFFTLASGMRALVAVVGVPVIYGNLGAVLGKTDLKKAMAPLFIGGLSTMGAAFIIAAILKGW